MSHFAFFGYGSLVNCATHSFHAPMPAELSGWRRVWRGTNLRKVAYLSVEPDQTCTLKGLVAQVAADDWTALDLREAAYRRHDISHLITHDGPALNTALYQVAPQHIAASDDHPILLSYLDVVVQGYLRVYGAAGVRHFFETTTGWNKPIFDDRADPIYPRHQRLSRDETATVDAGLAAVMQQAEQACLAGKGL